jgi:hypothetical protein
VKIFVIGTSGAGKTPVARQVADALGVPHVAASAWVRRVFPPLGADASARERDEQVAAMTRFSIEELRADPFVCLRSLDGQLASDCVVEGMRNPFDLVHAFDPRTDLAVFLTRADNPVAPTEFERGVGVIRAYLAWLRASGIAPRELALEIALATTADIESAAERVVAQARALGRAHDAEDKAAGKPLPHDARPARVHADIAPLALTVDRPLLHGGDPQYTGQRVACTAFAFSSYPGSVPTFKIVLPDGAVFSYVAPSALRAPAARASDEPELALDDLVYHACPSGDVVVSVFAALAGDVLCYFKKRDRWLAGTYRFTVDWYTGNDLLHCVTLANGQIAFLPHHKIKFAAGQHALTPGFAPYKKLRVEWKLTPDG